MLTEEQKNWYTETLRKRDSLRKNPYNTVFPEFTEQSWNTTFALLMRDPRLGFGERDLGRVLLYQVKASPRMLLNAGRADDIFVLGLAYHKEFSAKSSNKTPNPYWDFLYKVLTNPAPSLDKFYVKKWMPRERKNAYNKAVKQFRYRYRLDSKSYRNLISTDATLEYILSSHSLPKDYFALPRLAIKKYKKALLKKEDPNFIYYLSARGNNIPARVRYCKLLKRPDFNVELTLKEYSKNYKLNFKPNQEQ